MRAFNKSNNSSTSSSYHGQRSKSSCSYCGDVDHQVTSCPHVKSDWACFQSFNIPCSDPDNWTNNPKPPAVGQSSWSNQTHIARWFKDPTGWSKWHAQCEKAYGKIIKAEERQRLKASKGKGKTKRVKSCGFCGGIGHNRRDCPKMTALNERLVKANTHWRQRLYAYFVQELGLGEGALVKVQQRKGHWNSQTYEQKVAIITSINWDELNMFCYTEGDKRRWSTTVHEHLKAPIKIVANVGGESTEIQWKQRQSAHHNSTVRIVTDGNNEPLIDNWNYNWNSMEFVSIVSPTETPLDADWLTQGQQECVQFITKKYSLAKLKEWKAIEILENYESKYNLN